MILVNILRLSQNIGFNDIFNISDENIIKKLFLIYFKNV